MESQIESRICKKLEKDYNCITIKQTGLKGIPDRLIIPRFKFPFFIEFKYINGKLSKHQKYMIERLANNDMVTVIYIESSLNMRDLSWIDKNEIPVIHDYATLAKLVG